MDKKILFTANTLRHLYLCHMPYLKYFKALGYEVHTASDDDKKLDCVDKAFKLSIKRTPYSLKNIKAIFEMKKILKDNHYDIIHTHTPMGAVVTRVAAMASRKKGTKVMYTAHGFHFFKKCPILYYVLYYPIEKILSKYTDVLITINEEDYNFAKKHFKTNVKCVPGVGFNEEKFSSRLTKKEQAVFRQNVGLDKNDYIISYVAEISKRKRHDYLLKTISKMDITNEKFLFIGDDSKIKLIEKLIKKYNLSNVVKIIGFNDDVSKYLDISDLIVSVSRQEGLPLNVMEAMYKEKPIIVTDCRGNRDLIKNKDNGLVVSLNDKDELIDAILYLKNNNDVVLRFGNRNRNVVRRYSISAILPKMKKIYGEIMRK